MDSESGSKYKYIIWKIFKTMQSYLSLILGNVFSELVEMIKILLYIGHFAQ